MSSMNRVFVMGNLTKDPETKQLQGGTVVGDMRMAISESYTNKAGEKKETVCYIDVVVWGRQAETCKQYLHKGSSIFVEGRLQYDSWEKDGQKRSMIKIRADNVQFLGGKSEGGGGGGGEPGDAQEPEAGKGGDASFPGAGEGAKEETPF